MAVAMVGRKIGNGLGVNRKALRQRQQSHHLQVCGPVMAVAEVIETRAYFCKRGIENPEPPPPQKRQRLEASEPPDGNSP